MYTPVTFTDTEKEFHDMFRETISSLDDFISNLPDVKHKDIVRQDLENSLLHFGVLLSELHEKMRNV